MYITEERNMKKQLLIVAFAWLGLIPVLAQDISKNEKDMDRIENCKKNYTALFGGEALTGKGTDPEMMDILQKFIFGEVFATGGLDLKTRELLVYCILTTLGADSQLVPHALCNVKLGNSKETLAAAVIQCLPYVGFPLALNALKNLSSCPSLQGEEQIPLDTNDF